MSKFKRILSFVLVILMVLSITPNSFYTSLALEDEENATSIVETAPDGNGKDGAANEEAPDGPAGIAEGDAELSDLEKETNRLFGTGTNDDGTTNGEANPILVSVSSMTPGKGASVLAGDSISWMINVFALSSGNYKYDGFNSTTTELFDTYKNTVVTFYLPEGIKATSVNAPGATYEIKTDDEGHSYVEVNLSNISAASDWPTSFTVVGEIQDNGVVPTGTEYAMELGDIFYETTIEILDRNNDNAVSNSYTVKKSAVEGNVKSDDLKVVSTTNDAWMVRKDEPTFTVSGDKVVATYNVTVAMADGEAMKTNWSDYAVNGRVPFETFSLTDTPTAYNKDDSTKEIIPTSVTIAPANFSGISETGVTSATTNSYATNVNSSYTGNELDRFKDKAGNIIATVPIYGTYTVTVEFDKADFTSNFYDVQNYAVHNDIELKYTLQHTEDSEGLGDTLNSAADGEYQIINDAVTMTLSKYIDSKTGSGDYITQADKLAERFDGEAVFSITPENNGSEVYIKDGENFIAIDGTNIVFEKGKVTVYEKDGNKAHTYNKELPAFYILSGTWNVEEVTNNINDTAKGGMTVTGSSNVSNSGGVYTFTAKAGDAVVVNATNTDTKGSISFKKNSISYKGGNSNPLSGVEFGLFTSREAAENYMPQAGSKDFIASIAEFFSSINPFAAAEEEETLYATATSNANGVVDFSALPVGTYYIRELSAPEGYLMDDSVYEVVVTANTIQTKLFKDGKEVTFIENRMNEASILFQKWIMTLQLATETTDPDGENAEEGTQTTGEAYITRTAVGQSELDLFDGAFKLQISKDSGKTWEDATTFGLMRNADGSSDNIGGVDVSTSSYYNIGGLSVFVNDDPNKPYYYRIVETLPKAEGTEYTGYKGNMKVGDETTTVTFVDSKNDDYLENGQIATKAFTLEDGNYLAELYNQTTGSVSMSKWYYYSGTNGMSTAAAGAAPVTITKGTTVEFPNVTGYLCRIINGKYVLAAGSVENSSAQTELKEDKSKSIATINDLPLIDENGEPIEYYWLEAVPDDKSYILDGSNGETVTIDGLDGEFYASPIPTYASIYSYEDMAVSLYNILPVRRLSLIKYEIFGSQATTQHIAGAGYRVVRVDGDKEVEVYTGTSSGSSSTTVVLEAGYEYRLYESVVPANTTGPKNAKGEPIEYVTIDLREKMPNSYTEANTSAGSFILYDEPYRKVQLEKSVVDSSGTPKDNRETTFKIYVSSDPKKGYKLLKEEYTSWDTVLLKPDYYYVFVEDVPEGYIDPAVYAGDSDLAVEKFYDENGEVITGVTTGLLEASRDLLKLTKLINYPNVGTLHVDKLDALTSDTLSGATLAVYTKNADGEYVPVYVEDPNGEYVKNSDGTYEKAANSVFTAIANFFVSIFSEEETRYSPLQAVSTKSGVDFSGLPVYDENGKIITYYVMEVGTAPKGYFLSEDIVSAELIPGLPAYADPIYDEPKVTVSVQVTWEDCYEAENQTSTDSYKNLPGATVVAYKAVKDENGKVLYYEYVTEGISDQDGIVYFEESDTFEGFSRKEEYIYVLASSGVTEETVKENRTDYPDDSHIYASENGKQGYLEKDGSGWKQTLTAEDLAYLNYLRFENSGSESEKNFRNNNFDSDNKPGNLNNHKLYTYVDLLKYCSLPYEHDRETLATLINGEVVSLVNGSSFAVYRYQLSDEEKATLMAGGTIDLAWNLENVELLETQESGGANLTVNGETYKLGGLSFAPLTYAEDYVYWIVETSPTAGHTWPEGTSSYRVLIYANNLDGSITSDDATEISQYKQNEGGYYEVENIHNPGSPHIYFRTYLYMNKWQGKYDEYGDVIEGDTEPLGGAGFKYYLMNDEEKGVQMPLYDGQEATSMSSYNNLGYLGPGALYWTEIFNDFIVAIVNESQNKVVYKNIGNITLDILNKVDDDLWYKYSDLLYVAESASASYMKDLTDITDNSGEIAKMILDKYQTYYQTKYPDTPQEAVKWNYSLMEDVMAAMSEFTIWSGYEENKSYTCGSFYAHVKFKEITPPARFLENENLYEMYVGFTGTGPNGAINTKFYYLDNNYYTQDPGYSNQDKDLSLNGEAEDLSNEAKSQIVNYPNPEYGLFLWKYGYTMNANTLGKTNDELDEHFSSGADSRVPLENAKFTLQRWDNINKEWKYFSYNAEEEKLEYVNSEKDAVYTNKQGEVTPIVTSDRGYISIDIPIGYYRLFESNINEVYEAVYDGSTRDGAKAAVYFFVRSINTGNTVSVYNPLKTSLTIKKDTLSTYAGSLGGVEYTLTNLATKETRTVTTYADGTISLPYITSGTWEVRESYNGTDLTSAYFKPFTITVGYEYAAKEGTYTEKDKNVYITKVIRDIQEDGVGVVCDTEEKRDAVTQDGESMNSILTVHNPRTGELTIYKRDAYTNALLTAGASQATFNVYFKPFTSFEKTDSYVADVSKVPSYTPGDSSWTLIPSGTKITTIGGSYTISNLTPGWYAVVEITAPQYYELADPVVVPVQADMTEGHNYVINSADVYDTKKTTLTDYKYFDPGDFYTELATDAKTYKVTIGLYVKDSKGNYYYASDLGLATAKTTTITTSYVDTSSRFYNSSWWYLQIVQMGQHLNSDNNYVFTAPKDASAIGSNASISSGDTVTLDGKYYVKEESVTHNGNNIAEHWWLSQVTFTYTNQTPSTQDIVADKAGYYCLGTGFEKNLTANVRFYNSYSYAQVTIQKTGTGGVNLAGATFGVYPIVADENGNLTYYPVDGNGVPSEVGQPITRDGGRFYDANGKVLNIEPMETSHDNGDGSYTIKFKVQSTVEHDYAVYEIIAPPHYMLGDEGIFFKAKSGTVLTYANDDSLTMEDDNGLHVYLIKYDNVHSLAKYAEELNGVQFKLFVNEKEGSNWSNAWTEVETGITGESVSGDAAKGVITFDTITIDPDEYRYALVETKYDEKKFGGLESIWVGNQKITETVTINDSGVDYTGYILPLTLTDIGMTYVLKAYNLPLVTVNLYKTATDKKAATAELHAFPLTDEDELLSDEKLLEKYMDQDARYYVTTTGSKDLSGKWAGYKASSGSITVPAGRYLIFEQQAFGGYTINKKDTREIWYQIVDLELPSNGKTTIDLADNPFVNVKEDYSVKLSKSGPEKLDRSLLESDTNITYTLTPTITNSGALGTFSLTDSGLRVTKLYKAVTSDDTVDPLASEETALEYTITSVTVPRDAGYVYENMAFTSGDKGNFREQIIATVIFTYEDKTKESHSTVLASLSSDWVVAPKDSAKKAVSFTVSWADTNLQQNTGYALGENFTIGTGGVKVDCKLYGQSYGNIKFFAVAEIENAANAYMGFTHWDGNGKPSSGEDSAKDTAKTAVPNVDAPILNVTKSVTNGTQKNNDKTAMLGDELIYTVKVENKSTTLNMDDPIIIDLLPRGLYVTGQSETADGTVYAANVKITDANGNEIEIAQVRLMNGGAYGYPGYQVLIIDMDGSINKTSYIELTLSGTVDSSIINYLSESTSIVNNVWVTSKEEGKLYNENPASSTFKGDTKEWASDLGENGTYDAVLGAILSKTGFNGFGYINSEATIEYTSGASLTLLKEVQGDLDGESWYSGTNYGSATGNMAGGDDDGDNDGYAKFRLTISNPSSALTDVVAPNIVDIFPCVNDYSLTSKRGSNWKTVFESILSIELDGKPIDAENYTVYYNNTEYTLKDGNSYVSATGDFSVTLEQLMKDPSLLDQAGNWKTQAQLEEAQEWAEDQPYTGIDQATAFFIKFADDFVVRRGSTLVITYKTTPEELEQTEFEAAAHSAARNNFSLFYKEMPTGSNDTDSAGPINRVLNSNEVNVLYEPGTVDVGGMVWIDANANGHQDANDVVANSAVMNSEIMMTANDYVALEDIIRGNGDYGWVDKYHTRTNYYRDWQVVKDLVGSVSIVLQSYSGATPGTTSSKSNLSAGSSVFTFDELKSAVLSDYYKEFGTNANFGENGIIYNKLKDSSTAPTYLLTATIGGDAGVKYRVTDTRASSSVYFDATRSDHPANLYEVTDGLLSATLKKYWDNEMSEQAKAVYDNDEDKFIETELAHYTNSLLDSNFASSAITSGSTSVNSERFFLFVSDAADVSKDIGLTLYRDLEITKEDEDGNPIPNASFTIYGPFNEGEAANASSLGDGKTVTTGQDGKATVSNLYFFQEYIIKENNLDGYDLSEAAAEKGNGYTNIQKTDTATWLLGIPDQNATAFDDDKPYYYDQITVKNSLETGDLIFNKVETDNVTINVSGATFTLSCENTTVPGTWNNWGIALSMRNSEWANMGISNVTFADGTLRFTTNFANKDHVSLNDLPNGTYKLKEISTATANGYELDKNKTYEWTVTINGDNVTYLRTGETESTTSLTIDNDYKPKGDITLYASKTEQYFESENEYTFNVYESNASWAQNDLIASGTVKGEGKTALLNGNSVTANYTSTGKYYYIIKEDDTAPADHIKYDTKEYLVTVNVTDPLHNGKLTAVVESVQTRTADAPTPVSSNLTGAQNSAFSFTNVYDAKGSLQITVNKTLWYNDATYTNWIGEGDKDSTFRFHLEQGAKEIQYIDIKASDLIDGKGQITFDKILYDISTLNARGEYTYRIYEEILNGDTRWIKDNVSYILHVKVTDNTDGTLNVEVKLDDASVPSTAKDPNGAFEADLTSGTDATADLGFYNVYNPSGSATLTFEKTLDGKKNIPEDTFGVYLALLELDSQGNFIKDKITDPDTGKVDEQYRTADGGATEYIGTDGTVSFTSRSYGALHYTATGTYWYLVHEVIPEDVEEGKYSYDTTEYFVKVVVSDNGDGTLGTQTSYMKYNAAGELTEVTGTTGITFLNLTTVGYSVTKKWDNNGDTKFDTSDENSVTQPASILVTLQRRIAGGEWENVLDKEGNAITATLSGENSWYYLWTALPLYDSTGDNTYQYRAVELNGDGSDATTIEGKFGTEYSVDNSDSAYEFTEDEAGQIGEGTIINSLKTGGLKVKKTVTGDGADKTKKFTFTVKFTFDDGTQSGTPLTGSYQYSEDGGKTWKSFDLPSNGEYPFTLAHGETIEFRYLPIGVIYTVSEAKDDGYYTTVNTAYTVDKETGATVTTGEINENTANAEVVYTNDFAKTELTLYGKKTVSGSSTSDLVRTFTINITKPGNLVPEASVNIDVPIGTTSNPFELCTLNYTLLDLAGKTSGDFIYEITESQDNLGGYAYDKTKYIVTVSVEYTTADGELHAAVTNIDKITVDEEGRETTETVASGTNVDFSFDFINEYEAKGSTVIKAVKYLDGVVLTSDDLGKFKFYLTEGTVENNVFKAKEGAEAEEKTPDEKSNITFEEITYKKDGQYWYKVEEGELPEGYMSDGTVFYVRVDVKDNGMGELTATQTWFTEGENSTMIPYDRTDLEFENFSTVQFTVTKAWKTGGDTVNAGVLPEHIYVQLKRATDVNATDWEPVGEPVKLTAVNADNDGNWTYTWTGLQKYFENNTGYPYVFQAVEIELDETGTPKKGADGKYKEMPNGGTFELENVGTYSVTYDPVNNNTQKITNALGGDLMLTKKVENSVNADQEYRFYLSLNLPEGMMGEYNYDVKDNGTVVDAGIVATTGSGAYGSWHTLKANQILTVHNLPIGTSFIISEGTTDGYTVEYEGAKVDENPNLVTKNPSAFGKLTTDDTQITVTATNTYEAEASVELYATKVLNDGYTAVDENIFTYLIYEAEASNENGTLKVTEKKDTEKEISVESGNVTTLSKTLIFEDSWTLDETTHDEYLAGVDYWYVLKEKNSGGNYEYDDTVYFIKINVIDENFNGEMTVTTTVYTAGENGALEQVAQYTSADDAIDNIANALVFSNYSTVNVSVKKTWLDNDNAAFTRPDSVLVVLQKQTTTYPKGSTKGTTGNWENALDEDGEVLKATLNNGNRWEHIWNGLRTTEMDSDGNAYVYSYRVIEVVEKDGEYKQVDANNLLPGLNGSFYLPKSKYSATGSTTITNELQDADLSITKRVRSAADNKDTDEFEFVITFYKGNTTELLSGDYSYTVTPAKGTDTSGTITGGSKTIKLVNGQTITITGLPVGTTWKIEEKLTDKQDYTVLYQVTQGSNKGTSKLYEDAVTGTMDNEDCNVTFTNTQLGDLLISKSQTGGSVNDEFTVLVYTKDKSVANADWKLYSGPYTVNDDG